jgi:hypothetical protein
LKHTTTLGRKKKMSQEEVKHAEQFEAECRITNADQAATEIAIAMLVNHPREPTVAEKLGSYAKRFGTLEHLYVAHVLYECGKAFKKGKRSVVLKAYLEYSLDDVSDDPDFLLCNKFLCLLGYPSTIKKKSCYNYQFRKTDEEEEAAEEERNKKKMKLAPRENNLTFAALETVIQHSSAEKRAKGPLQDEQIGVIVQKFGVKEHQWVAKAIEKFGDAIMRGKKKIKMSIDEIDEQEPMFGSSVNSELAAEYVATTFKYRVVDHRATLAANWNHEIFFK